MENTPVDKGCLTAICVYIVKRITCYHAGMSTDMEDLRYPIGKFSRPQNVTDANRRLWIRQISEASQHLRAAITGLTNQQLDTPYRPGGWTIRQVVHHLADSQLNAYVRLRLALTEQEPTIKPYDEKLWAELSDAKTTPPDMSIDLLQALNARFALLAESLTKTELMRVFRHPEYDDKITLETLLAMYAWHGRHHVAHITSLKMREGWR